MRNRRLVLVARLSISAEAITELGIVSSVSSRRAQSRRAEADALDRALRALYADLLADPERVLADQEQRAEEILECILRRKRGGQADQAQPGQKLRERLAAADQIDLERDRQQKDRELYPVGGRRHDHVTQAAAIVQPLAPAVEDHRQVNETERRPAHEADPRDLDRRYRHADDRGRQVEQPDLEIQAPQAKLER